MYRIGIDLGSSYTKGVLVDSRNKIIDRRLVKTGFDFNKSANKIIETFSVDHEIQFPVFTCGYGREEIQSPFVPSSEIMALSKAVYKKYKQKCSIIDIGGQDIKFIKINKIGQVDRFRLNRKCAAGTGSFLEEIAYRLDISPEKFNDYALQTTEEIKINSFRTVFAVSEIIDMIKKGIGLSNIILGLYNSIVERCIELSPIEDALILTGGIPDMHPIIINLFRKKFANCESPEKSQFFAAYGCVLINS
ncbi:MAG: hypothetical protein HY738_18550 [Bacteroidia bacterium]|nr:hypothetical protein [Bacteroidia bacterium]